jgi:hypothetical protein
MFGCEVSLPRILGRLTKSSSEVLRILEMAAEETRALIIFHCNMHKQRPYTQNEHYFLASREKIFTKFTELRQPASPATRDDVAFYSRQFSVSASEIGDNALLSILAYRGHHLKSIDQLARLQPPDEYEQELRVISEGLGIFQGII